MTRRSFNEAVLENDLELLLASTKRTCNSIIHSRNYTFPPHTDVEDIVQEAMIKLLNALKSFDSTKASANTYCETVISRMIVDYVRKAITEYKYRDKKTELDAIITALEEDRDLIEEYLLNFKEVSRLLGKNEEEYDMSDIMLDMVETLTPRQQEIFVLRQKGYIQTEIAKVVGVTPKTVRSDLKVISEKLLDLIY